VNPYPVRAWKRDVRSTVTDWSVRLPPDAGDAFAASAGLVELSERLAWDAFWRAPWGSELLRGSVVMASKPIDLRIASK